MLFQVRERGFENLHQQFRPVALASLYGVLGS
jgi:hypothetical protein